MNLFPRSLDIVAEKPCATPPAVTVIVTLYNYARHIADCLDSIAAQTQSGVEIVIVDDKSDDASLALAAEWLKREGARLAGYKLIAHRQNMGLAYSRNTAFRAASSPRVFVMDADNLLYPRAIAACMAAMDESGSEGAYTQLELFGDATGIGEADFWSKDRFKRNNYIDAMALVSKAAWAKAGGYKQLSVSGWEDYDLWCTFVELGFALTFVPEILCRYRVHGASMLQNESNPNAGTLILDMSIRHPWLDLTL